MDSDQAHSQPSPYAAHFGQQTRHFYVALDRIQFKMETLVDLLGVAGRCRPGVPIVICCCSRDELDSVCTAVADLPYISLSCLHSDQSEKDRMVVLENFKQTTMAWNQSVNTQKEFESECKNSETKSHLIVVTDACLPLVSCAESSMSSRVLINYELPLKKDMYMRRTSSCLAQDGTVITMVVGGEVVTFKSLEESSGLVISEMPINVVEMF